MFESNGQSAAVGSQASAMGEQASQSDTNSRVIDVDALPATSSSSASTAIPRDISASPQRVVVLCAVLGAGKSTLSKAWVAQLPGWARVCQDELGNRQTCEEMLRFHLAQGKSVIVDRQNFDKQQRKTWIDLARSAGVEVCAVVLTTPYGECRRRLALRVGHETISSPEKAVDLLDRFYRSFRPPTAHEDFDRIVTFPQNLPQHLDKDTLASLVARIDAAPRLARQQTLNSMFASRPQRIFGSAPSTAWRAGSSRPF